MKKVLLKKIGVSLAIVLFVQIMLSITMSCIYRNKTNIFAATYNTVVEINTEKDFNNFVAKVNNGSENTEGKHYKLSVSISSFTTSIGTDKRRFKGKFECLYNCSFNNVSAPIFGYVENAYIKNVEVMTGSISADGMSYVGAIACFSYSTTFERCLNSVVIQRGSTSEVFSSYLGGIVGFATNSAIVECTNIASIKNLSNKVSYSYVCGIVGLASGSTRISNCQVFSPSSTNTITLESKAKELTSDAVIIPKNSSTYYSMFESANQEAQNNLSSAIVHLKNQEGEVNGIRNNINSLKKQITDLTNEANASWLGLKWSYIGPTIAGLEVAIGAQEAALAIAEGALYVAKAAVEAATKLAAQTIYDLQYINSYQDSKKIVKCKHAYAYGVCFAFEFETNVVIENCFISNITITNYGYENVDYKYYLQFWQ